MSKTCIAIGLFVALATTACEPPQTAPTLVTPAPATTAAPLQPQSNQPHGSPVSILD
jgi:hypothetical protein